MSLYTVNINIVRIDILEYKYWRTGVSIISYGHCAQLQRSYLRIVKLITVSGLT